MYNYDYKFWILSIYVHYALMWSQNTLYYLTNIENVVTFGIILTWHLYKYKNT